MQHDNSEGAQRQKRTRIKSYTRDERSYTHSHNEERPYRQKTYGGPRPDGDRPYRNRDAERPRYDHRDGERPRYRSERPYNSGRPYNSERPRYDRDGERPQHSDRPRYRSERPYNSERPRYDHRSERPQHSDRPRYRSERPYNSDRPYNNDRPQRSDRPRYDRENSRPRYTRPAAPVPVKEKKLPPAPKQEIIPGTVRLNKFIANSGLCSRREADTYITTGLVTVNGEVVDVLGTRVDPNDDIRVNGQRIKGERKVYIVMNKPKGFVTTVSDDHAEKTVMDLLAGHCDQRVYPVGRLDKATMGVLLFTNDGDLTEQLTHPSYNHKKIYQARLNNNLKRADMEKLVEGIELEDGPMQVDMISYIDNDEKEIGLEIHSGRNRVVRRLFEALGYKVMKLDRVYFAGLTKKNLKRGQWRFLTEEEISRLKTGFYQ